MKKSVVVITAILMAVSTTAFAEDMAFNQVRINIEGTDTVQWGEELELGGGEKTPYSIIYNGTTYIPLRKIGTYLGKKVEWDGDTRTVYLYDEEFIKDETAIKYNCNSDMFDTVSINIDGKTVIYPNKPYVFDDGTQTPYSIIYNDTTYLPMRQLCELLGKKIYWNADSRTVSITDNGKDFNTITEKADKYGHIWEYYTFAAYDSDYDEDIYYIAARDKERGYERVYRLADTRIKVTDNDIYFARNTGGGYSRSEVNATLVKLAFNNDENSQDGEIIEKISYFTSGVFDGNYYYYALFSPGITQHGKLYAYNLDTGESYSRRTLTYTKIKGLDLVESNAEKAKLKVKVSGGNNNYSINVDFDKTSLTFSSNVNLFRDFN